jgi:hypothetical protein
MKKRNSFLHDLPGLTTFALSLLMGTQALADADFSFLDSTHLRVLSNEECQAEVVDITFDQILRQLLATIASTVRNQTPSSSWTPTGEPPRAEPYGCEPQDLEKVYFTNRSDPRKQSEGVRDFFARCDMGLRTESTKGVLAGTLALAHVGAMTYNFCNHPNIRKIALRLNNGEIVRGALALKPGTTPRPLVIAKCGMLCNTGDSGMSLLLMHLYDESPFNVLVLANNTSADFVRDNSIFIPGGFKEGQQIVEIARLLRASAVINPRISSLHVVGMSLGGHASLYASYLAGLNLPSETSINSTLAACPAVDLETAINGTFTFNIRGIAIGFLYDAAIERAINRRPELNALFTWRNAHTELRMNLIGDLAVYQMNTAPAAASTLVPFTQTKISTAREFWQNNNFAQFATRPLAGNTLAIASNDDEVVDPAKNMTTLQSSNVATALTPSGDHCAWSEFYGWRISSALFRGYVLSQSPEMLVRQRLNRVDLPPDLFKPLNNINGQKSTHYLTSFRFAPGLDGFTINHRVIVKCGTLEIPGGTDPNCYRDVRYFMQFSRFTTPLPWWAHAPLNATEAEALTRWANVNLKAVAQNGYLLDGTTNPPVAFVWLGYDDES